MRSAIQPGEVHAWYDGQCPLCPHYIRQWRDNGRGRPGSRLLPVPEGTPKPYGDAQNAHAECVRRAEREFRTADRESKERWERALEREQRLAQREREDEQRFHQSIRDMSDEQFEDLAQHAVDDSHARQWRAIREGQT